MENDTDYIKKQNENLIKKFKFNEYGFYDQTPFDNQGVVGFSVKKKFDETENVTLIRLFIGGDDLSSGNNKKPLFVDAEYRKENDNGPTSPMPGKIDFNLPIHLNFKGCFYYNVITGEFYENNKKISGDELINDVYNSHIKPTKKFKGAFLRIKLYFWKIFLKNFFYCLSKFFYWILWLISGDIYTYQPVLKEGAHNGTIVESGFKERIGEYNDGKNKKLIDNLSESKRLNFFGYDASYWSLVFYSGLHLLGYWCLYSINFLPTIVATIFKNAFLTVVYAIFSLWIFERAVPKLCKLAIKHFAIVSFKCDIKSIRI